jgi:hypothetical protein
LLAEASGYGSLPSLTSRYGKTARLESKSIVPVILGIFVRREQDTRVSPLARIIANSSECYAVSMAASASRVPRYANSWLKASTARAPGNPEGRFGQDASLFGMTDSQLVLQARPPQHRADLSIPMSLWSETCYLNDPDERAEQQRILVKGHSLLELVVPRFSSIGYRPSW